MLAAVVGTGLALLAVSGSAGAGITQVQPNARAAVGPGGASAQTSPLVTDPALYDQNNNNFADAYISWTGFPNALADDFVVPPGETWHITSVFTPGADVADLSSVTVTLYSDSSGSPGSQVYTVTVPSGSFTDTADPYWGTQGYPGGDLTVPIDATLTAGHYWLSVVGNGGSFYYWGIRSVVSNNAAMSLGGVCGGGWTDMATCFNQSGDPNPADLAFTVNGTSTSSDKPTVDYVTATPGAAKSGTSVTLTSKAEDPNGLTDIYYNLFTSGGTFVCNLAHVSIAGSPTSYTDTGTVIADPAPFAGLDTGAGGPCPAGGISEGQYVIAANYIDGAGHQEGDPNNQVLSNYPASAQFSPFYYDTTAPTITITTPADNATYTQGSTVYADYSCDDGSGSGVATCVGNVPDGSPIDTSNGQHTFTVNATDNAGNQSTKTVHYLVVGQLTPGTNYCDGYYAGTGGWVIVPSGATCILMPGTTVIHTVTVQRGGTLFMTSGVTVDEDMQIDGNATIADSWIGGSIRVGGNGTVTIAGDYVGRDIQVYGNSGEVAIIGNEVEHNLTVQRDQGDAVIVSNYVGGSLEALYNHGGVTVIDNSAGQDLLVHYNWAPTDVIDNSAGRNATCFHNGGFTGVDNSAQRINTCNNTGP